METLDRPQTTRKSLPLTEQDLADLAKLRRSVDHRQALAELSHRHIDDSVSEAALLQAVLEAGLRATQDRVEEEGYATLAQQIDTAERRQTARRRRPTWADES